MVYEGGIVDDYFNYYGNILEFLGIFIRRDFILLEEELDILEYIYKSFFMEF